MHFQNKLFIVFLTICPVIYPPPCLDFLFHPMVCYPLSFDRLFALWMLLL